jgi:ACS family glucarate transporter-like MFS transporter
MRLIGSTQPGILESADIIAAPITGAPLTQTWRVVSLLCTVTCVGYLVRADVAVAQERMVPALGLTMTAMGAITAWGFQFAYTVFQVPAGLVGERVGARTALTLALLGCSLASFTTGLMPESPAAAVPTLWITRVLLGISQAAIFPVAAMAVMVYVRADLRVRATSFYISASVLGAAMAPLLMAPTMEWLGWRAVFISSGVIGVVTAVVWRVLMPSPAGGAGTTPPMEAGSSRRDLRRLIGNPHLRRLSLAYLLHSAVWFVFLFWFFRYLVEGRGFTVLASGVWASLPSLAGFVAAPLIGVGADRLGVRLGAGRARRLVAMACLLAAAAFVGVGAVLPNAVLAIVALSLASGCINGAEAPFFVTATALGAASPGTAAGLLNLMGNLGGVLSIWLVPHMAAAWGWIGTLAFWSAACVIAALLWLTVRVDDALAA